MIDYHVNYANHKKFSEKKTTPSPIRIFSNIDFEVVILPESEGYKYCPLCRRWTSKCNKHCVFCGQCTAKSGARYQHCNACDKCVKVTWIHCQMCAKCHLKNSTICSLSKSKNTSALKKKNR